VVALDVGAHRAVVNEDAFAEGAEVRVRGGRELRVGHDEDQ
jgi:hypothetical protein